MDLILERSDKPPLEILFARPARGKFEQRLDSVEKILQLLDEMPAAEPGDALLSRTLERIEAAQAAGAGPTPHEKPGDARPQA